MISWVDTTVAMGGTASITMRPTTARNLGRFRPAQIGSASPKRRMAGMATTTRTYALDAKTVRIAITMSVIFPGVVDRKRLKRP